ncbi:MAG TPA: heterodisulfide reductase-related iron-sulfur binding cluster, partial [Planctomycetota bacterium]|nr:heterodisulfide reductase-related iron-sulfur binding cluster [Planctomycetota bacterium]
MDPVKVDAPTFEQVSTCVHCGLCLEACPTYKELRVEMDSPRGRIYLMKGLLEEKIAPTEGVLRHLDQCLDCRACETACPSGVPYAAILERTRQVLEPERKRGIVARFLRWFGLGKLLPSRRLQAVVFKLLWLQKILGLTALARWMGRRKWLPGRLSAMAVQAPSVPFRSFRASIGRRYDKSKGVYVFPARGEAKHRVALFTGCLADHLLSDVHRATIRVLTENGCEVEVLPGETCCGALHIHNGARDEARVLAKKNIAAFNAGRYDAVISNAAGCSAELRHYGDLFNHDAAAEAFGRKIRDVAEFLVEIGAKPPPGRVEAQVAYDEPCHLLHAQKISAAPKALLKSVPGVELVGLEDAEACCGSAGIYSVTEPGLSDRILKRKVDAIRKSACSVLATGNP